jgi:hypothetical protein
VLLAYQLAFPADARGQEVEVEISELSCNSDPEVVVVTNLGQTPIDMTGWNLQSDPTPSESLALQQFGSLSPGETLMVESGPAAEGAFVWSQTAVFRDDDPSDFAQLASDAGEVLLKVNCGDAGAQSTTTPAAATSAPASTAAPAATVLTAAEAPAGGGPAVVTTSIPPALIITLGTGLLMFGLGTFSLPFGGGRRRPAPTLPEPVFPSAEPAPAVPALLQTSLSTTHEDPKLIATRGGSSSFAFFALIGLALLAALLLALQAGGTKKG